CLCLAQGRSRPHAAPERDASSGIRRHAVSTGLSSDVQRQIEALRQKYPTARALLLPALHMVQKENGGWLPEPALLALADYLALPPSGVMGVVTFYDMYHERPVGRHRIRVCTNLSCMLRGSEEIMEA